MYKGELKNLKPDGHGELTWTLSGTKWEGQFEEGYFDGVGICVDKSGCSFQLKFDDQIEDTIDPFSENF